VLGQTRINVWTLSGVIGYFNYLLIPIWSVLSICVSEAYLSPYQDRVDNCLKEVQLALRLLDLKTRYGDAYTRRHLNFGDIEMVLPILLGGQDDSGKIHFSWSEFAGFYGQFPGGISKKTSCAVHKVLVDNLIKVSCKSDDAMDEDKTDRYQSSKSLVWNSFNFGKVQPASESVVTINERINTTEQQRILNNIMSHFSINNESIWGVRATMDELFQTQGIIATDKNEKITANPDEWEKHEWEKILQQRSQENVASGLDKDKDLKNMKDIFYNKYQEKALRLAISNMKPRILRAVDRSYKNPIEYKQQRTLPSTNHCLVSVLGFLGKMTCACISILLTVSIILYLKTSVLSALLCTSGFTGPGCSQKVCNSCSSWRDREGRTCLQYKARQDMCIRLETGSSLSYYRNDDGIDARQACCECWDDDAKRNLNVRKDMCDDSELNNEVLYNGQTSGVKTIQASEISGEGTYESPVGVAPLNKEGNAITYVLSDSAKNLILVLTGNGQSYVLAGNSLRSELLPNSYQDGVGSKATFHNPYHLCVSNSFWQISRNGGDTLVYVADSGNHAIRQIAIGVDVSQAAWVGARVTTVAGGGSEGFNDGIGRDAKFSQPSGIAVTPDGKTIIVADTRNNRIRFIDVFSQAVRTAAGTGEHGYRNGAPLVATFAQPVGVSVSGNGRILAIADSWNHLIRSISLETTNGTLAAAIVSTLAGVEASPGYQASLYSCQFMSCWTKLPCVAGWSQQYSKVSKPRGCCIHE
jgi:hypothetical protein